MTNLSSIIFVWFCELQPNIIFYFPNFSYNEMLDTQYVVFDKYNVALMFNKWKVEGHDDVYGQFGGVNYKDIYTLYKKWKLEQ